MTGNEPPWIRRPDPVSEGPVVSLPDGKQRGGGEIPAAGRHWGAIRLHTQSGTTWGSIQTHPPSLWWMGQEEGLHLLA